MTDVWADLAQHGFAKVAGVLNTNDLRKVEQVLDALVLVDNPRWRRFKRELADTPESAPSLHLEFSRPTLVCAQLTQSTAYQTCKQIAARALGTRAFYLFDHAIYKLPHSAAIYKLPHSAAEIPWHQDQAYLGSDINIRSVHFWIPMQDTDVSCGCLRFISGSHKKALLPHVSAYSTNAQVLKSSDVDGDPIDVPLRHGDLSIHTNLTLHSSAPNYSNNLRKAWIIHFGDRPNWYKHVMQAKSYVHDRLRPRRGCASRTVSDRTHAPTAEMAAMAKQTTR